LTQKRRKIWIDRFQTYLFLRIGFYCVLYQAAVWLLVMIQASTHAALDATMGTAGTNAWVVFMGFTVLVVGGLLIRDVITFAHRLVGPLYRFRQTIKAIAAGEEVDLITLRKKDFLHDLQGEFNAMLKALASRGAIELKSPEAKSEQRQPVSV
jgi:nitrogen fixation/metabolism regulation signal transduction histidine kinase